MDELSFALSKNRQLFGNPKQAAIYLAILRLRTTGVDGVAKQTKLHRETVQREIVKMTHRGTVKVLKMGRNRKFEAVQLSVLQQMLEQSNENFNSLLKPLLEAEATTGAPEIKIYTGNHAFALLQLKLLKVQPEHESVYVISAHPKAWREAMVESRKLRQFENLRLKKTVGLMLSCFSEFKGEVEHNNREYFTGQPQALKRKYRYVETKESSPLQIQVWHNTVLISMFSAAPSLHIAIDQAALRKAMKAYFDVLWAIGA